MTLPAPPPAPAAAPRLTLSQQFPGQMLPVRAIRLSGYYGAGEHAIIDPEDDQDYPAIRQNTWFVTVARANATRWRYVGTWPSLSLARLLTGWQRTGHINGDTLDCRRVNLCPLDKSLQQASKPPRAGSSSRFKGVTRTRSGTWQAAIICHRTYHYLGTYPDEEDAARAYDRKALELFGPYAMTNQRFGLYDTPPGGQVAPAPPDRAPDRRLGPDISARVVGANIRDLRLRHGWTQADLARKLGCTPAWISLIEAGKAKPSPALLSRIADTFAVPAQTLTERAG